MKESKEKNVSCGKTVFSEALRDGRLSCRGRPLEGGWWQKQKEERKGKVLTMSPQNELSQARPEGSELVRSKAAGVPKGCHWHAGISTRNHGLDSRLKQAKTSHLCTQVMTKAWRVKKLANILDTKVIQRDPGVKPSTVCLWGQAEFTKSSVLSPAAVGCLSTRVKLTLIHKQEGDYTFTLNYRP